MTSRRRILPLIGAGEKGRAAKAIWNEIAALVLTEHPELRGCSSKAVPMALTHSTRNSGLALVRYFASVLFAIAVIVIGLKIAVDHWPCEFLAKGACTSR